MIITFRPELDNPPMAKECSLGFSFLPDAEKNERTVKYVRIESGVTRDFDQAMWDKIEKRSSVQRLLKLGALAVTHEVDVKATTVSVEEHETISDVQLTAALGLIEGSFNIEQLNKWNAKDSRIRVKNAIAKRIQAITEGNG